MILTNETIRSIAEYMNNNNNRDIGRHYFQGFQEAPCKVWAFEFATGT